MAVIAESMTKISDFRWRKGGAPVASLSVCPFCLKGSVQERGIAAHARRIRIWFMPASRDMHTASAFFEAS